MVPASSNSPMDDYCASEGESDCDGEMDEDEMDPATPMGSNDTRVDAAALQKTLKEALRVAAEQRQRTQTPARRNKAARTSMQRQPAVQASADQPASLDWLLPLLIQGIVANFSSSTSPPSLSPLSSSSITKTRNTSSTNNVLPSTLVSDSRTRPPFKRFRRSNTVRNRSPPPESSPHSSREPHENATVLFQLPQGTVYAATETDSCTPPLSKALADTPVLSPSLFSAANGAVPQAPPPTTLLSNGGSSSASSTSPHDEQQSLNQLLGLPFGSGGLNLQQLLALSQLNESLNTKG